MTTGARTTGDFCWINVLTPQPAQAREFFSQVLGWSYTELPGMGHIVQVDGHDIGGLWDLHGPNSPAGLSPTLGVMVRVDSADAIAEKAIALGGKAKPAFDVMENGRMAELTDPNGAQIDVWQPKKKAGMDADSTHPGVPSWFETLTTDAAKASKFYSDLFGWTAEAMPMKDLQYTTFKHNDAYVGGMLQITPKMGHMPPQWVTYFTVNNADETVAEAVRLGAKVCMSMKDIESVGRFSGLVSPQGVTFYVIQYPQ